MQATNSGVDAQNENRKLLSFQFKSINLAHSYLAQRDEW